MKSQAALLQELIAQGEHQQQDFKYKVDDARKLARSVSAFANTDGGRLLIGVRDDGSIHGVRSDEEIFMMHAAACKYCSPVPTIKFETLHVPTAPFGGKLCTVVICTVAPSAARPVFALEAEPADCDNTAAGHLHQHRSRTAYVRIDDENIAASPLHLAIWRQEARLQGEAFADTDEERALLATLNEHPEGLTLNQALKATSPLRITRQFAITILARFIRFGLATLLRRDQQWIVTPQA